MRHHEKQIGFVAIALALVLALGCQRAPAHLSETATASASAPASQARPLPFPVIDLRGDGAALGAAHGKQLGDAIRMLHTKYLNTWFKNPSLKIAAQTLAVMFESHLSERHRQEIHALAQATGIDERDVMLGNCFLDVSPMTACSTIALPADASPDGVARFGRNLDFPSFNIADKYSVLMIYHPAGKNAFAAVSWPGLIGVLSGINEHGLALANMEVSRGQRLPQAVPYTLLYRTVLEECRTVPEAVEMLRKAPRQTANNLMLMDAAGDRAVVEITPNRVTVRRAGDHAALISTNHHRGVDMDTPGKCERYDLLHQTAAATYGRIDESAVKSMLAKVGGRMTLQAMIFEPANCAIILSVGSSAAKGRFYRVELKKLF
jgi:isopenicillin-N N-acyltransferase-like protein